MKNYIQSIICYTYPITIRTMYVIWKCRRIICQNNGYTTGYFPSICTQMWAYVFEGVCKKPIYSFNCDYDAIYST